MACNMSEAIRGVINNYFAYYPANRGSYMSAHVLLNLLNELEEKIRCAPCYKILP